MTVFSATKESQYSAASNTTGMKTRPDHYTDNITSSHAFYADQGTEVITGDSIYISKEEVV